MFTSASFAWKVTFTSSTHSHYILITRRRRESCWDWSHPAMRMPSLTTTSPSSGSVRTLLLLKKKWIAMLLLVDNLVLLVIPLLLPIIYHAQLLVHYSRVSFQAGRVQDSPNRRPWPLKNPLGLSTECYCLDIFSLYSLNIFRAFHRVLYRLDDLLLLNMLEARQ